MAKSVEELNKEMEELIDSIIEEDLTPYKTGAKLDELSTKSTYNVETQRTLDVMFLRKSYQINKRIKSLTGFISILTVANVILVAITTYFIICQ